MRARYRPVISWNRHKLNNKFSKLSRACSWGAVNAATSPSQHVSGDCRTGLATCMRQPAHLCAKGASVLAKHADHLSTCSATHTLMPPPICCFHYKPCPPPPYTENLRRRHDKYCFKPYTLSPKPATHLSIRSATHTLMPPPVRCFRHKPVTQPL